MNMFETNPRALKHLLTQIHDGELALPDFQRDFVWEPSAVEELIESIMRNYPAGSLLLLKHSGQGFQIREFEGAPSLKSKLGTSYLVLDGQQRLTSLYQAFYGKGEHRFFIDIQELIESGDLEEAVWHESEKRSARDGLLTLELQAEKLLCPLHVVMGEGFDQWVDSVMDLRKESAEARKELRNSLRQVQREWIQPILDYQFPVITLSAETSLDAVCKMFETLNRRGVKLTVFELLMARSYANNVSLRQLWDEALEEHPILAQFDIDPYYVLQIVSLLSKGSIKRSDVLDIETEDVAKLWAKVTTSLAESIEFLRRNCGVLNQNLLPYNTLLVPMAAVWARVDQVGPKAAKIRSQLEQWFWASVFSQAYEKGPSSRAVKDYKDLLAWLLDGGVEPVALRAIYFNSEMFMDITPKQRALYRGALALVVSNGALDFHKAEGITFDYLQKHGVDDHHIFPANYLKKNGGHARANLVLNKTLIDSKTNRRISDKAPETYLAEIEKEVGPDRLNQIFESHVVSLEALRSNDFDSFLEYRATALMKILTDRLNFQVPSAPTLVSFGDDEIEDEGESANPRERFDPKLINAYPTQLISSLPNEIDSLFKTFSEGIQSHDPDIWWKSNARKIAFWSPRKVYMTCRPSKNGLHLTIFTDGKPMEGVEPIIQRDRGGELWGRIKLRHRADLEKVLKACHESRCRLQVAIQEERATAWWAMTRAQKVG